MAKEISLEQLIDKFHVEELQEILEELGAKKSGRKSELVERVISLTKTPEKPEQPKKPLVDEVISYLKAVTIPPITLNNERDLERYMFGKLEEFFSGKKAKINPQSIGTRGTKPDIIIERGRGTVIVELKYIKSQSEYMTGIAQTLKYTKDRNARVILFCYDPDRKIKETISIPKKDMDIVIKPSTS